MEHDLLDEVLLLLCGTELAGVIGNRILIENSLCSDLPKFMTAICNKIIVHEISCVRKNGALALTLLSEKFAWALKPLLSRGIPYLKN